MGKKKGVKRSNVSVKLTGKQRLIVVKVRIQRWCFSVFSKQEWNQTWKKITDMNFFLHFYILTTIHMTNFFLSKQKLYFTESHIIIMIFTINKPEFKWSIFTGKLSHIEEYEHYSYAVSIPSLTSNII